MHAIRRIQPAVSFKHLAASSRHTMSAEAGEGWIQGLVASPAFHAHHLYQIRPRTRIIKPSRPIHLIAGVYGGLMSSLH